jgi:MFS family permease
MNRRLVLTALGIGQILAWGSSYYLPAVLAEPIVRDTQWPLAHVVGGLSLGLLVAALISPRVGVAIERCGGRHVLAMSAVALGLGQIGLAIAPNLYLHIAAWLVVGLGMGAGLYDAAFATLGRLYGREARAWITALTLFGGFASTVCWPLSALLVSSFGWRGACLTYAAIQFGFVLPLYLLALPRGSPRESPRSHDDRVKIPRQATASLSAMLLLALTLTLAAALSATLSVHLLTILQAGGLAAAAAVGLGALVGPCQVAARMIEAAIARYHHPIWTKVASASLVACGISALCAGLPVIPALASYGAGIGLESVARGTLPLALFGASGYATLMGRLAMPSLLAQAGAPWIGALLLEGMGSKGMLGVLVAVAFLNVALALGLYWTAVRPHAGCCDEAGEVASC